MLVSFFSFFFLFKERPIACGYLSVVYRIVFSWLFSFPSVMKNKKELHSSLYFVILFLFVMKLIVLVLFGYNRPTRFA